MFMVDKDFETFIQYFHQFVLPFCVCINTCHAINSLHDEGHGWGKLKI